MRRLLCGLGLGMTRAYYGVYAGAVKGHISFTRGYLAVTARPIEKVSSRGKTPKANVRLRVRFGLP